MDADLTVLAAGPPRDIKAIARVTYTIRGGRMIFWPER